MEGVKTAGMVHGTPDWQLDRMYENESDRIWAEQNQEHPEAFDLLPSEILLEVYTHLLTAKECNLDHALEWIGDTMNKVVGTPEYDKLASIYDSINNIVPEVMKISNKALESWRKRAWE